MRSDSIRSARSIRSLGKVSKYAVKSVQVNALSTPPLRLTRCMISPFLQRRRALEHHVLDPVRDARDAGHFIARADPIPHPERRNRRGSHRREQDHQAVVEMKFVCLLPSISSEEDRS